MSAAKPDVKSSFEWNNCNAQTNGEMLLWNKIKPHCKLIVDVGVRSELTYPDDGKIVQHCFEPNPRFCADLKSCANDHIFINPVGLGSKVGTFSYFEHSESVTTRVYFQCKPDCHCKKTIQIIRLDDYVKEKKIDNIDFIKVDTEGFELEVLKGATETLKRTRWVQFEYGGTYPDNGIKLADVYAFFKANGFPYIYLIQPNRLHLVSEPIENYQYSNYFASRTPFV